MQFTKHNASRWMRAHLNEHVDNLTGEVNATSLAEACADAFDVRHVGGPLDQETHWIWDIAADLVDTEAVGWKLWA